MAIREQLTYILLILVIFPISEARKIDAQENGLADPIYQTIDQVISSPAPKLKMVPTKKQKWLGRGPLLLGKMKGKENKSNNHNYDGKQTPMQNQLHWANKALQKKQKEFPIYASVNKLKKNTQRQPNFNGFLPANGGESSSKEKSGLRMSFQKIQTPPMPLKDHIYEEINLNPARHVKQQSKDVINTQGNHGIHTLNVLKKSSGIESTHQGKRAVNFVNRCKRRSKEDPYSEVKDRVWAKEPPKQEDVDSQNPYSQVFWPADGGDRLNSNHQHHNYLQGRHFKTLLPSKSTRRPHYLAAIRKQLTEFKMTPEEVKQNRRQKNKAVQQEGPRNNIVAQ